jgi:4-diphosphocytidyl-2-C-methyl-D-erythritol kinase
VAEKYDIPPVKIHLHKILPTGAGLGGGSSDGAFMLRLLNEKFGLGMHANELKTLASQLGSDCAFFLQDLAMVGSGRGEILDLAPVSLRGKYMVIVKPPIHVSTAEAYAGVQPKIPDTPLLQTLSKDIRHWSGELMNDFESSVFQKYPSIKIIKEELYRSGAIYASMSGSGASVFGIFDQEVSLASTFEGMNYWGGVLPS